MSNWMASSPARVKSSDAASVSNSPKPIATITIEVFSTNPGDNTVTVWADKAGAMADAQGDFGAKRQQAVARLKNIGVRALTGALDSIAG